MKFLSTISIAAVLAAGPALANYTKYGEAGGWNVFVNNDKGLCFMEKADDMGNVVHLDVLKASNPLGAVAIYSTNGDMKLKEGERRSVTLYLDGQDYNVWITEVTEDLPAGFKGGYMESDKMDFYDAFYMASEMVVSPHDKWILRVNISGAGDAMTMTRTCTAENFAG